MPTPSAVRWCPEARSTAGVVVAAALAAALASAVGARAYVDRPPPGHTGGFGEPTCASCHRGEAVDAPGGSLTLGVPAVFAPGEEHVLEVRLTRPGMERAGFQLTARFAEGERAGLQAGELRPGSEAVRTVSAHEVTYAGHSVGGAKAVAGEALWRVRWVAPEAPVGPVVFHVAANAADFDDSEYGDFVYLASVVSQLR